MVTIGHGRKNTVLFVVCQRYNKTMFLKLPKRFWIIGTVFMVVGLIAHFSGLKEIVSLTFLQEFAAERGSVGIALYFLLFVGGVVINIPGVVFTLAALAVYGPLVGGVVSFFAACLSTSIVFLLVKFMDRSLDSMDEQGQEFEQNWLHQKLAVLEEKPIRTIVLVRFLLYITPPANIALSLTQISFWQHFVGPALGIVPPIMVMGLGIDVIIGWF